MVEGSKPLNTIPASVPDGDVPAEKVETASDRSRRIRRVARFLKGPIPFTWIRGHVVYAADRLLLVLKAHTDMQRVNEIRLTTDILRDAGIADRKVAYRALKKLEAGASITVRRKRGRRPVVCLKEGGNDPVSRDIQKTA